MAIVLHAGSPGAQVAGVWPDHLAGLIALALAPGLAWVGVKAMRGPRYRMATPATRLLAGLLLTTGVVHLALVPSHVAESPASAVLFGLDGVALCWLAAGAFEARSWWRPVTVALIAGNLLGYPIYLAAGWEALDDLGAITKLVEVTALGLAIMPRRRALGWAWARWWSAGVGLLAVTVVTGTVVWGASLVPHAEDKSCEGHHHDQSSATILLPAPCQATAQQRVAAARLADDTRMGIQRYQDVAMALAAGYRSPRDLSEPLLHYNNPALSTRGVDPRAPQTLVYTRTRHGMVLLGALFVVPHPGLPGPDVGGPLTQWHYHRICVSPVSWTFSVATPFGDCPPDSVFVVTPAMLHVWTIDNPTGPYGDLDNGWLARLRAS